MKKWLKWGVITGVFVLLFDRLVKLFTRLGDDFDRPSVRMIKKEAAKRKEINKKLDENKKKRKNTRNKYSKIYTFLFLLLFLLPLNAEYIVWDMEDHVFRDYGSITNYAISLKEEKKVFLNDEKLYKAKNESYSNENRLLKQENEYLEKQIPSPFAKFWGNIKDIGLIVAIILAAL